MDMVFKDGSMPVCVRGSDTSENAAESMRAHVGRLRRLILLYIKAAGQHGRTCDEVEDGCDMRHQTASARINELRNGNLLADSGKRRMTRSKRYATVWVLADPNMKIPPA
jgi:hypothetical protein